MADRLPSPALLEWYHAVEASERHARATYEAEKTTRLQRQQWDSVVARGAWEQQKRARRKTLDRVSSPPPPALDRDVLLHIASFLAPDDPLGPMARVWSRDGMTVLRQEALRRKWSVFSQVPWTLPAFQEEELWVHERLIPWGSEYARRKTAREESAMIQIMSEQLDVLGRKRGLHGVSNNNVGLVALSPICACGGTGCEGVFAPVGFDWSISGFPDMSTLEWYDWVKHEMDNASLEERLNHQRMRAINANDRQRQLAWRTRQQEGFRVSDPPRRPPQPRHEKGSGNKPSAVVFKRR